MSVGFKIIRVIRSNTVRHEITSLQTKQALSDALKSKMRKKSLSKISITDIVTEAAVNRKTFYYHFADIYELLRWTFEQDAAKIVSQYAFAIEYTEVIAYTMDYIESNEYIISCTMDSLGLEALKDFFYKDFITLAGYIINARENISEKKLDDDYKQFLQVFFASAISSILFKWFCDGHTADKGQVCNMIKQTIESSLDGIFK